MKQDSWRQSTARAAFGQSAQSKNEAMLHDAFDLVPIIGDIPNLFRISTSKGNRKNQTIDFMVGAIPVIGDIADLVLTPDTNLKQFEMREQKKGKTETIITASWIPNAAEKYGGGVDRSIWED